MTKKEIFKELDKLGVRFKAGEPKAVLSARLKRAQRKLAKKEEPKEEPKEVEIEVKVEKPKAWYWGPHKKIVRKFEDLGNGETKVYFDDSHEVVENAIFKANIREE